MESLTYIQTAASEDPDPLYPDVELMFVPGSMATDFGLIYRRIFNIPKSMYNKVWKPLENRPVFSVRIKKYKLGH